MKPCVWYDVEEKLPAAGGYYLAFKGMSMGDSETGCDYYYWNAKYAEWRDSQISSAYSVNVVYWCDADPAAWYGEPVSRTKTKRKISEAEQDAWRAVEQAIERYEVVRNLVKV